MRVLHVVATRERRGAEMFAADLVRSLNREDVDQRVAVLRSDGRPGVDYEAPSVVLSSDGRQIPGLRLNRDAAQGLRVVAAELRPDVIQVHGGEPLKHAVLSGNGGIPVVYRRIGSAPIRITRGVSRLAHGHLMRRATRVVAVADALRRETIETFRVPAERVVAIPNAVDLDRMRPSRTRDEVREELGIHGDAPVIISLGALTWEKDPLAHLHVTRRVLSDHPRAVHLFVGGGPLEPDLERAILRARLGDNVRLLRRRSDVPDLLAASDLMLLASRVEGLPGCLIEGGIMGVPAAAFAVSGVPEVVEHGRTGLLAAPGDVDSLAASASSLLGDRAVRISMGEAARYRCRALFDIRTVAPHYLELYEELS